MGFKATPSNKPTRLAWPPEPPETLTHHCEHRTLHSDGCPVLLYPRRPLLKRPCNNVHDKAGNNQASITKKVFKQAAVTCIDRIGRKLLKSGWKTKGTERCSEHVCVCMHCSYMHMCMCVWHVCVFMNVYMGACACVCICIVVRG